MASPRARRRPHDPPDHDAVGEHVEIVIVPFAGRTRSRGAFEDQWLMWPQTRVVLLGQLFVVYAVRLKVPAIDPEAGQ
jgi:hypothetical protein